MNRTHATLAGLLLVQLLLILLIRSPFAHTSSGVVSHTLLPELEAFAASRIELLDAEEGKVTLVRGADGWTIEELAGFPADGEKIDDLIDDLRELKVRRPVVSSNRYHESFKVRDDEFEGRVRLFEEPGGDPEIDLILGSSPNYRALHVRRAGEAPVYEVRGLATYDVRPDKGNWIDQVLVEVPESELVGLSLRNANGTIELLREGDAWRSPGLDTELDADAVGALVEAARSIRLADAVGARDAEAQGFTAGTTLTLRWKPSADEGGDAPLRETTVTIGETLPDQTSQRFITRDDLAFAGAVWESSVLDLLERKLDELVGGGETATDGEAPAG